MNPRQVAPLGAGWLAALVVLVNLAAVALLRAYSGLNLWPELASFPGFDTQAQQHSVAISFFLTILAPGAASAALIWPILSWQHRSRGSEDVVPVAVARRSANLPLGLASLSLLGWFLMTVHAVVRVYSSEQDLSPELAAHLIVRPILAGLVAASMTFFATEHLCRSRIWPRTLAAIRISGNSELRRVRISHRLLALWLAISLFPLGAVALTTLLGVAGLDLAAHPALGRVVSVVLLLSATAALGGAALAYLVARSIGPPLEAMEAAMARVREGHLDARQPVSATDETGALAEGFNLMASRLEESNAALIERNRELADALDRVQFLELVKRGLDRFVPDAVRRAVESNPGVPLLEKTARDVTVMFVDIEGYTRLSEALPRPALNEIVERYFSLYLAPIRAQGGDINETAGDGLMVIFQAGGPREHATAAVRAALSIRALTRVENGYAGAAHPAITVNIGISSGECDLGTTRFHGAGGDRWTFTASGPATILAARLGDLAAGGEILLAKETVQRIGEHFLLRSLGPQHLKNFTGPVDTWAVHSEAPLHL